MTEVQRKYLEWVGFNDYEIQEVETEIKNGEEIFTFEGYQFYTWESGYNKANEWHDLRKNPKDTPKSTGDFVTNIGVLTYDCYGNGVYKWHTPFCENCDYSDLVDDGEVIAWCEIPKFKE